MRIKITALSIVGISSVLLPVEAASGFPGALFDNFILHPTKRSRQYDVGQVAGVRAQDLFFTCANDGYLHGWYFKKENATKTVLLSHGIGGNVSSRVDLIELFLNAGTSVFIYDYQGYGRSSGNASLKNVVEDGHAAYKFLTDELQIHPDNIILAGESLGTGVTCALSKRVKACALILQSPFSSLARRVSEVVPFFKNKPTWLQHTGGLENDLALSGPHPPVLIVHGDKDNTVPVSHAHRLYNSAIGEKQLLVINGAGHTGDPRLMNSAQYLEAVRHFLHSLTPQAPLHLSSQAHYSAASHNNFAQSLQIDI